MMMNPQNDVVIQNVTRKALLDIIRRSGKRVRYAHLQKKEDLLQDYADVLQKYQDNLRHWVQQEKIQKREKRLKVAQKAAQTRVNSIRLASFSTDEMVNFYHVKYQREGIAYVQPMESRTIEQENCFYHVPGAVRSHVEKIQVDMLDMGEEAIAAYTWDERGQIQMWTKQQVSQFLPIPWEASPSTHEKIVLE